MLGCILPRCDWFAIVISGAHNDHVSCRDVTEEQEENRLSVLRLLVT